MFDFFRTAKWILLRKTVLERDRYTCQYCGAIEDITVDHIWPRSKGGKDELSNLIACCGFCNSSKSGRTLREWFMSKSTGEIQSGTQIVIVSVGEEKQELVTNIDIPYLDDLREVSKFLISGERTFTSAGCGIGRRHYEIIRNSMVSGGLAEWINPKSKNQGVIITKTGWLLIRKLAGEPEVENDYIDNINDVVTQDEVMLELEPEATESETIEPEPKKAPKKKRGDKDELFEQAKDLVIAKKRGSVSMLQTKLSIGYSRASRIMDQLETAGVVFPSSNDGKTRAVVTETS